MAVAASNRQSVTLCAAERKLQEAIRAGRVPVLGKLVRSGEASLHPWIAMLPPTTPAER